MHVMNNMNQVAVTISLTCLHSRFYQNAFVRLRGAGIVRAAEPEELDEALDAQAMQLGPWQHRRPAP